MLSRSGGIVTCMNKDHNLRKGASIRVKAHAREKKKDRGGEDTTKTERKTTTQMSGRRGGEGRRGGAESTRNILDASHAMTSTLSHTPNHSSF
jgi:hypothetical protein